MRRRYRRRTATIAGRFLILKVGELGAVHEATHMTSYPVDPRRDDDVVDGNDVVLVDN